MTNHTLVATWIKRFLQGYLISDRNLSANTQHSYRDTICLLVPFIARQARKTNEKIEVEDITAERIKRFLLDLEQSRHCSISTRNQRLAAIHSLAKFIGLHSPEHLQWCGEIRAIPSKKGPHSMITYLEQAEMEALLKASADRAWKAMRIPAGSLGRVSSPAITASICSGDCSRRALRRPWIWWAGGKPSPMPKASGVPPR